jgi:hypothetical protein
MKYSADLLNKVSIAESLNGYFNLIIIEYVFDIDAFVG